MSSGRPTRGGARRLVGAAVVLRRPTEADGDEVVALVRRSVELHRPWVSAPRDRRSWLAFLRKLDFERNEGWLVCRREDGAIAGVANISEIVRGNLKSGYLGFYAMSSHAGRGYMTEGLGLVLKYAFTALKLHRLEANIQPGNGRSIALVQRCGFRREGFSPRYLKIGGRWKDHERWTILLEEWRARGRLHQGGASDFGNSKRESAK